MCVPLLRAYNEKNLFQRFQSSEYSSINDQQNQRKNLVSFNNFYPFDLIFLIDLYFEKLMFDWTSNDAIILTFKTIM